MPADDNSGTSHDSPMVGLAVNSQGVLASLHQIEGHFCAPLCNQLASQRNVRELKYPRVCVRVCGDRALSGHSLDSGMYIPQSSKIVLWLNPKMEPQTPDLQTFIRIIDNSDNGDLGSGLYTSVCLLLLPSHE